MSDLNREKEIWAMALWVEKHHGENGWSFIAQQQDRLLREGKDAGARLWAKVAERFEALIADGGQDTTLN
jgi:hypothetical protein